MSPRKRVLLLVLVLSVIVLLVETITIGILYHTAITKEHYPEAYEAMKDKA